MKKLKEILEGTACIIIPILACILAGAISNLLGLGSL